MRPQDREYPGWPVSTRDGGGRKIFPSISEGVGEPTLSLILASGLKSCRRNKHTGQLFMMAVPAVWDHWVG